MPCDSKDKRQKWCHSCDEIYDIENFYKAKSSYQARCKKCHNKYNIEMAKKRPSTYKSKKNPNRKTPFQKLPQEKQDIFHKYYKTMTMKNLAKKMDIKINTLLTWKQRGQLPIAKTPKNEHKKIS